MTADMVLDYFCHQSIHRTADGGDNLQHVSAADLGFKCALDGFNLPTDTSHPSKQLGFFANGV